MLARKVANVARSLVGGAARAAGGVERCPERIAQVAAVLAESNAVEVHGVGAHVHRCANQAVVFRQPRPAQLNPHLCRAVWGLLVEGGKALDAGNVDACNHLAWLERLLHTGA